MEIFFTLLVKILPLYVLIAMGFVGGRFLNLSGETLGKMSIYFLVPLVMFSGVMKTDISLSIVMLPIVIWAVSCVACYILFKLSRKILAEKTLANILGLSAGTANSGYFGIPVAFIIFKDSPEIVGLYITSVLGMTLFQNSVGYYVTAIGQHSARQAFVKVLRLPVLYMFIAGVVLNYSKVVMPDYVQEFLRDIRGGYIICGMMIIGIGISKLPSFKINFKFLSVAFFGRFILWPALILIVIFVDKTWLGFFNESIYKAFILAGLVPLAADTVAIATILKCHPEEMATTVLISTMFALFYVPFMVAIIF
jgi:malate permease and related proteins